MAPRFLRSVGFVPITSAVTESPPRDSDFIKQVDRRLRFTAWLCPLEVPMIGLGMRVKLFTTHMRDHKQYNGRVGYVVGLGSLCIISPQDRSLSRDVQVRISESTVITIPEGCASRA